MKKIIPLLFGLFWMPSIIFSQPDKSKNADLDKLIQDLFQQQNSDVSYEDFYEVLFQYYANPIDLNKAERDDLESLYLLDLTQLNSFFEYKKTTGDFMSIYELQAIPGFDLNTIRKLLPFVEINFNPYGIKGLRERMNENKNKYFLTRYEKTLQEKKGYQTDAYGKTAYAGSPFKMYMRYRNSISRDFSIGFTLEKDAGEQLIWDPRTHRYLADYISFHACFFNKGKIKALALGDYQLQFGQGLIMGAGFYIGKGAETITTIKRSNTGLRPYTSAMESGFFRGIAATCQLSQSLDITGFYSNNNRDANANIDSLSGVKEEVISSLNDYGYHRTTQEINNKNTLNQQVFGYNISFMNKKKNLHIGNTTVGTLFNTSIQESDRIYNRFDFSGNSNYTTGIDYSFILRNFNFFGELALSKGGGRGLITGLISSLSPKIDFSFLYRNYSKEFHSFYGVSFSENTDLINEQGFYIGIKIKPAHTWTITAYYDVFDFPWLKYMTDAPSNGYGYMTRIQWNPTRKISLYAQLRYENKEKNQSDNTTAIDFVVPTTKYNYMFNLDYKAAEFITFRTRIMGSSYQQSNAPTFGYAILEDLILDVKKITISSRFSIFDTDDYDNRQYVYEKDVLYAVSLPAYDGQGIRTYLMVNYTIFKNLDMWIRYSITQYYDRNKISSGLEEIQGNSRSEIKIQLRYKF